jgi:hypothetical protein
LVDLLVPLTVDEKVDLKAELTVGKMVV